MSGKQISLDVRNLVIRDREKGISFRKIAEKYSISVGAVQHIWKKYETRGIVRNLSGQGRHRATSNRDDIRIVRMAKQNPKYSSRHIVESMDLNVSRRTVRRRLNESGLKSCLASKRPFINKRNQRKRLEFAKKYAGMTVDFWKRVLWTDESKFELFGQKRRSRVWRGSGDALKEPYIQKTVKHGGGNIMVWGAFAWSGVGSLAHIKGIMTADVYIDLLSENLEVSLLKTGLESNYIFQQDNDPKHTAKKTTAFFKSNRIKTLEWPPQSPDLNPIENLWSYLDNKVDKASVSNKNVYFEALEAAWENIDSGYLQNLVESMPRRLEAVLKAKGGHTKY